MPDMNNFISLLSIPGFFSSEVAFAITGSLAHFLSLHSAKPCAKYRRGWKFRFCDNLLQLLSHCKVYYTSGLMPVREESRFNGGTAES